MNQLNVVTRSCCMGIVVGCNELMLILIDQRLELKGGEETSKTFRSTGDEINGFIYES